MTKTNETSTDVELFGSRYPAISSDVDIRALVEENLNGEVDESLLTIIKVPAAGGTAFQVPSLIGKPKNLDNIDCVILGSLVKRAWWYDEFGTGGGVSLPMCTASDPKISDLVGHRNDALIAEHPLARELTKSAKTTPGGPCHACPMGQFGSHPSGDNRQWCRQSRALIVLRPGDLLPTIVRIPGTSDKSFLRYGTALLNEPVAMSGVVTRIGLDTKKSASGIDYSVATFEALELLAAEDAASMAAYRTSNGFSSAQQVIRDTTAIFEEADGVFVNRDTGEVIHDGVVIDGPTPVGDDDPLEGIA